MVGWTEGEDSGMCTGGQNPSVQSKGQHSSMLSDKGKCELASREHVFSSEALAGLSRDLLHHKQ